MIAFIEFVKKMIDIIHINIIIGTLYLASSLFVFAPDNKFKILHLAEFRNNYIEKISLIFIIITCYYLVLILNFLRKKIEIYKQLMFMRKELGKITCDEKSILQKFYNNDKGVFDTSKILDMRDGVVGLLESKTIISKGSIASMGLTNFSYFIQPWAYDYLMKELKNGNIKVIDGEARW